MDACAFSFRKILARTVLMIAVATLAAYLTWDHFSVWNLAVGIGAVILTLFCTALVAVSAAECRTSSRVASITVICLYLLAGAIIYAAAATEFSSYAFRRARSYPAQAMPFIEQYQQSHGTYPDRLDEIPGLPRAPQGIVYHRWTSEPGGYIFNFNENSFGCHGYYSETKAWSPID